MKILFSVLLIYSFLGSAFAAERSHEFSVGAGLGALPAAPWSNKKFSDTVSFFGLRGGMWARFHMPQPEGSFELSADRLDFAKSKLVANTVIASIFWRMLPARVYHPIFAFGAGLAMTENYFTSGSRDLSVYRIRLGLEYEVHPQINVGGYLDHFSIFRNKGIEPDVHTLSPTIAVIYYFQPPAVPPSAAPVKAAK
ncbi:MAG: hypothetical protein AB7K68_15510 [Bacteriovoracia bacterium]